MPLLPALSRRAAAAATLGLAAAGLAAPAARAQQVLYQSVALSPALGFSHVRIARGDFNGDGAADLFATGLGLTSGLPATLLLRYSGDTKTPVRGDTTYAVTYSSSVNTFGAAWGGDAIAHDLDGDGDADVLFSGANDTLSTARPFSSVATQAPTQSGGVLRALSPFPLPALAHARLAARGRYIAAMGRSAAGALSLTLLTRTAATGTAHTATPLAGGLELGALAFGDCDGDGDDDLFATGLDADAAPRAVLYRNDGGTFTATATNGVPGTFNGDALLRDLDGDGDADLALTGSAYGPAGTEGVTRVFRAQNCAFTPVTLAADLASVEGTGIAVGDLERDGADLIVLGRPAGQGAQALFVTLGGLAAPLAIRDRITGGAFGSLVVYDYDGDGTDDLLTVGVRETSVSGAPLQAEAVVVLTRARFKR